MKLMYILMIILLVLLGVTILFLDDNIHWHSDYDDGYYDNNGRLYYYYNENFRILGEAGCVLGIIMTSIWLILALLKKDSPLLEKQIFYILIAMFLLVHLLELALEGRYTYSNHYGRENGMVPRALGAMVLETLATIVIVFILYYLFH